MSLACPLPRPERALSSPMQGVTHEADCTVDHDHRSTRCDDTAGSTATPAAARHVHQGPAAGSRHRNRGRSGHAARRRPVGARRGVLGPRRGRHRDVDLARAHHRSRCVGSRARAAGLGLVIGRWGRLARSAMRPLEVLDVTPLNDDTVALRIGGPNLVHIDADAGQFFVLRPRAPRLWWQVHPYSLSDAPGTNGLRFTIKARGDASAAVTRLRPGTKARSPHEPRTCARPRTPAPRGSRGPARRRRPGGTHPLRTTLVVTL